MYPTQSGQARPAAGGRGWDPPFEEVAFIELILVACQLVRVALVIVIVVVVVVRVIDSSSIRSIR